MQNIITFYKDQISEYKDATLYFSNIVIELATRGLKVLVVDFDFTDVNLEKILVSEKSEVREKHYRGILDVLDTKQPLAWRETLLNIKLPSNFGLLQYIPTGLENLKVDESKTPIINLSNILDSLDQGLVEDIREEWAKHYDYVIINYSKSYAKLDSICLTQLPEIVFIFTDASADQLQILVEFAKGLTIEQQELSEDRQKLVFVPVFNYTKWNELNHGDLERISDHLSYFYDDWLPLKIAKKEIIDLTVINYNKIPGNGKSIDNLVSIIANKFADITLLIQEHKKTHSNPLKESENRLRNYRNLQSVPTGNNIESKAHKSDKSKIIVTAVAGAYLLSYGWRSSKQSFLKGMSTSIIGGILLYKSLSSLFEVINDKESSSLMSSIKIHTSLIVNKPIDEVYSFWRKLENLPLFMKHLDNVMEIDKIHSYWEAKILGGLGKVKWNAEIVKEEEESLIAWQSLPNSMVNNAGKVQFREAPGGKGTHLDVAITYHARAGEVDASIAKALNPVLKEMIRQDVISFKEFFEKTQNTGELNIPANSSDIDSAKRDTSSSEFDYSTG